MNPTTDPSKRSFIEVSPDSHFPIQNLPYGVFRPKSGGDPRCCSAIGDFIVDLAALQSNGLLSKVGEANVFAQGSLNAFAELGKKAWTQIRSELSHLLDAQTATLRDNEESTQPNPEFRRTTPRCCCRCRLAITRISIRPKSTL